MTTLSLTFVNAGDNAELDVEVEDTLRAEQIIRELIRAEFIPLINDSTRSYMLTIKGRNTIAEGQTLADAGVQPQDKIRVSVTQRGGDKE